MHPQCNTRALDVQIHKLRRLIAERGLRIITKRGFGYGLETNA